ncbi:MAG TPA: glycosyltransferase family 9 protein [Bryobacteraceae bacterium]|nr:glycosyltransferase family 9 protein [Bryobacteraceae bacterium]
MPGYLALFMQNVLDRLPDRARVAVIRLRSLGDCVLSTPALDILKSARPDLRIGVVVEDRFAPVFEGNNAVEQILPPRISTLRRWDPALSLNLHGGSRSAALTAASGASLRAGFAHFRFTQAYTIRIPRAQEVLGVDRVVHTAEHLAAAVFYLGAAPMDIPRARLSAPSPTRASRPYAVLHPVASQPDKTWPAERFLEVAAHLDMDPVFIAGPGEDLGPFHQYRTVAGAPLSEIKNLLAGASLFVGNDSGPAHMAAAFGLPVVAIFGSSSVEIWRPWKTSAETLSSPSGIESVSTAQVIAAVARLRVHV